MQNCLQPAEGVFDRRPTLHKPPLRHRYNVITVLTELLPLVWTVLMMLAPSMYTVNVSSSYIGLREKRTDCHRH
jgi:hypothetical protein